MFDFSHIDRALEEARKHNQSLYLRIPPYDQYADLPDWFRALIGPTPEGLPDKWRCDAADPLYVKYYSRFVRTVAARYDGHPDLECVDIAIIGFWGEGENTHLCDWDARRELMDAYLEGWANTLLVIQPTDEQTVGYSRGKRPDLGWRVDCIGDMRNMVDEHWCHMLDLYPQDIVRYGLKDAWKTGPVSLEACGVMRSWLDRDYDVDYIIEQTLKWHINNFNNKSSAVPPVWKAQTDAWLKKMGYRLAPRKVMFSSAVQPGGTLRLESWIENRGVSPSYQNYPFMLRLLYENGHSVEMRIEVDLRTLLPGDHLLERDIPVPANAPAGPAMLQWQIINHRNPNIPVHFGVDGRGEDGWYTLGPVQVG